MSGRPMYLEARQKVYCRGRTPKDVNDKKGVGVRVGRRSRGRPTVGGGRVFQKETGGVYFLCRGDVRGRRNERRHGRQSTVSGINEQHRGGMGTSIRGTSRRTKQNK